MSISRKINDLFSDSPKMPSWIRFLSFVIIPGVLWGVQNNFLYESLTVWLIMMFIVPPFFILINKTKTFRFFHFSTFFFTSVYAILLIGQYDKLRDVIGNFLLKNYNVYYEVHTNWETGDDYEIANFDTGNAFLDFFLKHITPWASFLIVSLILILSFKLNIKIKEIHKIYIEKLENKI